MKTFGEALRHYRKASGMSQRTLAAAVGLQHTYVSKIENDVVSPPSDAAIVDICRVLDIAPHDEMFRLAGKVPNTIRDILIGSRRAMALVRAVSTLSDNEIDELIYDAERRRVLG